MSDNTHPPEAPGNAGRVLIVDDSSLRILQLRQILGECGYEVVGTAADGQEGVAEFERLRPDIVIMDLIMPRMNGLDALQAILDAHPEANVVMASSMRSPESALECERAGARFYLHKPFEPEIVRKILDKLSAKTSGGE